MLAVSTGDNIFQFIVVLVIFVIVLVATYYVTKWIAGYQKNNLFNKNFEVVETMKIAPNKYLQIVKVGTDNYYILGIGKEEIHLIGTIDKEQLIATRADVTSKNRGSFSDVLSTFKDKIKNESNGTNMR